MTDTQNLPGTSSGDDIDVNEEFTTDDTELSTDFEGGDEETGNDESQPTSQKSTKTIEQLEHERRIAVKESLKNHEKAKTAKAQVESTFNVLLNTVRRNPAVLDELYLTDPDMADELTSQLPQYKGMTYKEALAFEQSKEKKSSTEDLDLESLVQKEIDKRLQEKVSQEMTEKIEQLEEEFFLSLRLDPKSFQYRKIRDEYKSFGTPTSEKQARAYFKAAKDSLRDDDDYTSSIGAVPSLSMRTGRSNDTMPQPSESYLQQAKLAGYDKKQALATWRKVQQSQGQF